MESYSKIFDLRKVEDYVVMVGEEGKNGSRNRYKRIGE